MIYINRKKVGRPKIQLIVPLTFAWKEWKKNNHKMKFIKFYKELNK